MHFETASGGRSPDGRVDEHFESSGEITVLHCRESNLITQSLEKTNAHELQMIPCVLIFAILL